MSRFIALMVVPPLVLLGSGCKPQNLSTQGVQASNAQASPFEGIWFPEGYVSRVMIAYPGGTGQMRFYSNNRLLKTRQSRWSDRGTFMEFESLLEDGSTITTIYRLRGKNALADENRVTGTEFWKRFLGTSEEFSQIEMRTSR